MGTIGDHALARNEYPGHPDVLSHVNLGKIVASKAHNIKEITNLRNHFLVEFSGFLLIIRNPVDCILGNLPIADLDNNSIGEKIDDQFDIWQRLVVRMMKTPMKVEIISYSDLISEEERSETAVLTALHNLFEEEIDKEKYSELRGNFSGIRAISAGAKGRTWNGVRSLNKGPLFYLNRLDPSLREIAIEKFISRFDLSLERNNPLDRILFDGHSRKFTRVKIISERVQSWKNELTELKNG